MHGWALSVQGSGGRYARGMVTLISMNTVGCDKLGMDLLINWQAGFHESGKSSGGFRLQFLVCEVKNDENIYPVEW